MKLLEQLSAEISTAVNSILPSLVEIETWGTRRRLDPRRLFAGDDYPSASGAGLVIRGDGIVITNHHVVQGSTRLCVRLQDGRAFEPEICGVDPVSDVAVLRVPVADLRPAKLSGGRHARLGEIVMAVGHPLGLTRTVSMGIVSAPTRGSMNPAGRLPSIFIQTDASISAGNSGGPLIGCDGEVIGINTWGFDPTIGENLAFAIPIGTALKVAETLLRDGEIAYGTLGVAGVEGDLPARVTAKHDLKQATALFALEIEDNGPAKAAGLQEGDWILSIDGHPIESFEGFLEKLDGTLVGKSVKVRVLRGADHSLAEKQMTVAKLEIEDD